MSQPFDRNGMPLSSEYSDGSPPAFSPTAANAPEVTPQYGTANPSPRPSESAYIAHSAKYPSGWPYEERLGSPEGRGTTSSPGLESVRYIESDKEAYRPGAYSSANDNTVSQEQKKRRPSVLVSGLDSEWD
ncbi:hypothetical protein LTR37_013155 [Vermiconidia calcicola]|uniref:Uncharacterized protein n=1 Tax=Vermiconidia calcicola TaxID=1690605 RepID=A0ACC3MXI0_9PEZI|nr:hypothetical protein LTR37_013155 [Vermiconidia calcicola]